MKHGCVNTESNLSSDDLNSSLLLLTALATDLFSIPRGAGALLGDAHAETAQAALGVGLREMEESGLALVTQGACHVVLHRNKQAHMCNPSARRAHLDSGTRK